MATTNLGRVVPILQGEYDAARAYVRGDLVIYNGSTYWHVGENETTGTAPTDATVWQIVFDATGAEPYVRRAETAAASAEAAQTAASASADNAAGSEEDAAASELAAAGYAEAAAASEDNAAGSADGAQTAALSAGDSAVSAANSAAHASDLLWQVEGNVPLTKKSVTAGSVAVKDAACMEPISLKAIFLPRRSGGIPAEISGFSLRCAGKNLADPATVEGKGGTTVTAAYDAASDSIRVVSTGSNAYGYVSIYLRADTTYTFRAYLRVDSGNARFVLRKGSGGGSGSVMPASSTATTESGYKTFTFTPEETATYALCMYSTFGSTAGSGDVTFSEIQCEVGESATAYERANNVRTVTVSFVPAGGASPVAIRAGELELTAGVLTQTWDYMAQYDGSALPGDYITADGEPPVVGQPVAYELATPVTYQLTPLDYKLLRGGNTVWNGYSGDSTALTYYVDDIMMLQAQIDELRALALENNG